MINYEIKSQLAKLLATEDIVVENRDVMTAQFDVDSRVLTLPKWKRASNSVYDMLVGHEVGHALYTPNVDPPKDIPHSFINIVEDARIEKKMKHRYPGLAKSFFKGYKELSEEDFFCLGDQDLRKMNLADRINLYYKIGNFVDIPFENDVEKDLMKRSGETETFDEVLDIAEEIYKYCLDQKEKESKINFDNHGTQGASGSDDQGEEGEEQEQQFSASGEESESSGSDESEDGEMTDINDQQQSLAGGETSDPDVKTMSAFEDAVREQLLDPNARDNVYVELPELNLDRIIVSNAEIHQRCVDQWNGEIEARSSEIFYFVDEAYTKFKRNAQKEVNYLVKEFECRKSAAAYARASTSKTGVLDCTKLHTYKYNEDLFKKVTTFADGKNHGLVFVLDWSGSMGDVMLDTMKQLFNLVWFCKKVGIPFDVYAFTNDYPRNDGTGITELSYEKRDGLVQVREYFSMMNMLTSSTKGHELEKQMIHIWRLAKYFSSSWGVNYLCPVGLSLSGTPLNEALVSLTQIIPNFKSDKNVEKVQCVILTDGEAPPLKYHKLFERLGQYDEPFIGTNGLGRNAFIRDRKTGRTYSLDVAWYNQTNILLRILRDRMPSVNFVGIRVLAPRDAAPFIRQYAGAPSDYEKMHKTWKKEKSFTIKNSGYHKYFGLSSAAMSQDSDFDVKEDATKGQIKNAFVKSLRSKKMNKKVLGEFIELIA